MPYCPPVHSSISSVHQLFIQLVDAGFARPTDHQLFPEAYSKHFGSVGVSQYIIVQAIGWPGPPELQLLHPSK